MIDLTEGIPQDASNPLAGVLDPLGLEAQKQAQPFAQAEAERIQSAQKSLAGSWDKLDAAVLDLPGYMKKNPEHIGFAFDKEAKTKQRLAGTFLRLANGGIAFPNQVAMDVFRDNYAEANFGGRGKGDYLAFFSEMEKQVKTREGVKALFTDLHKQAATSELVRSSSEAGLDSMSWELWREEAKKKPGYSKKLDADLYEAWTTVREEVRGNLEPHLGPLKEVRKLLQEDKGYLGLNVRGIYDDLSDEERPRFMASLRLLADTIPAEKQATFWSNIDKTNDRAWQGAVADVADFYQTPGRGNVRRAPRPMVETGDMGMSAEQADQARQRLEEAPRYKRQDDQAAKRADMLKRKNFRDDIERIRDENYDPIRDINPDSKMLRGLERVAYGLVGTAPFLVSGAMPVVGTSLMYAQGERMLYREIRHSLMEGKDGLKMSDAEATEMADFLAPIEAAPYTLIEKLQIGGIFGKLPGLEKTLNVLTSKLTNRGARFFVRGGTTAALETVGENAQDFIPAITQEIASALDRERIPGTVWRNGRNGFLDGYWENTAVTFGVMLPLSVFTGLGGVDPDLRAKAITEASDLHLRAGGFTPESIASIRAAEAKGPYSLSTAIEAALPDRNPLSEDAKQAVAELEAELTEAKAAFEEAELSGVLPTIDGSRATGYTVRDGITGDVVGTAETQADAMRLASAHSSQLSEEKGDMVAYFASLLEGTDQASAHVTKEGDSNRYDIAPQKRMTEAEAALLSPGAEERFASQAAMQDRLAGGDGKMLFTILGLSVTDIEALKRDVRDTTNYIRGGGTVKEVVHEKTHAFWREARFRGRLTFQDGVNIVKAYNEHFRGRTVRQALPQKGQPAEYKRRGAALLPEDITDADITEEMVDEAISEIIEIELFRAAKTGSRRGKGESATGAAIGVESALTSRNITSFLKVVAPQTAKRLSSFIEAVRTYFALTFGRTAIINKAAREGKFDEASKDEFIAKLFGLNVQDEMNNEAERFTEEILGGDTLEGDPFSISREVVRPEGDHPFTGASYSIQLTAIHNLSEENLEFADRMGGLAVPSVAVVPAGQAIDGFGRITLIGGRPLADPKENPVFDADAYTVRFPKPDYKKVPVKTAQSMVDFFRPWGKKFSEGWLIDPVWDNAVNTPNPDETINSLKRSNAAMAAFLSEQGITVEPVMKEASLETGFVNAKAFEKLRDGKALTNISPNDEAGLKEIGTIIRASIAEVYADKPKKVNGRNWSNIVDSITEQYVDPDTGMALFGPLMRIERDIGKIGTVEVDKGETGKAITAALAGKELAFYSWIEGKIRGMYEPPRIKVGGKFEDYSLDNIVRVMKAAGGAGKENTMTFSEGQIRAMNATRFRSVEQMREAAATGIVGEEEAKEIRESLQKRLSDWREAVIPYYKWKSTWDALDNSMEALGRFLKGPRTPARMMASLKGMDFEGVPTEIVEQAIAIGEDFMKAPVPYFESKPQRIVRLDEFKGAVVPSDASERTIEILKSHGLEIEVIPAEQAERGDAREEALSRLATMEGVSFSIAERGVLPGEFPANLADVVKSTSLAKLKSHPGYNAAKKEADGAAAVGVVLDTAKIPQVARELKARVDPSKPVVLVPVIHRDIGRRLNAIPLIYAKILGTETDWPVSMEIVKKGGAANTGASLEDRSSNLQTFEGEIDREAQYILVDDTFTSGDTLMALYEFITKGGGKVVAFSTIAAGRYQNYVGHRPQDVAKLLDRAGVDRDGFRREIGFPVEQLTGSEVYRFANLDRGWKGVEGLRSRIDPGGSSRRDGSGSGGAGSSQGGGEVALSIGPARMADDLIAQAQRRVRNPKERLAIYRDITRSLSALRRDADVTSLAFGKSYTRKAIDDPRKLASIRKEGAFREAARRAELEEDVAARWGAILEDDELVKLKAQPVHAALSDPKNPLKGRLRSKSKFIKDQGDMFTSAAEYDGSELASRTLFGGTLKPDQAAQELFEEGLIREPSTEAMWSALEREAQSVQTMKRHRDQAEEQLREARKTAKSEAAEWEKGRIAEERKNYSTKARLLRAMAMMDGIINALPVEIRGRIGGYTALATLSSDEKRLEYLKGRLEKTEEVVETYLRREYGKMMDKLLERSKPAKDKAGKKPVGKAGHTVHSLFAMLPQAMKWDDATVQAHAAKLEKIVASGEIGEGASTRPITAQEEAHFTLEATLVRLAGNWNDRYAPHENPDTGAVSYKKISDGADAARRAAAVEEATKIFEAGYATFRLAKLLEIEDQKIRRNHLRGDTGKAGTEKGRKIMAEDAKSFAGSVSEGLLSFFGFEQMTGWVFGDSSAEAKRLVAMELAASNAKEDALQAAWDSIEEMFIDLSGGRGTADGLLAQASLRGQKLRESLADVRQDTDKNGKAQDPVGIKGTNGVYYSQLEAITATLMWRQPDGKRHMIGKLDENGQPIGEWHYDQAFIDALEAGLSPEAQAVRQFISDAYAGEYAKINPVFQRINGINLPKNDLYAPLTVEPLKGADPILADPLSGTVNGGVTFTPGSLLTRGTSIAQPKFIDALKVFEAHTMQIQHWLAYAEFTKEANSLLNNRDVMNSVAEKAGAEAVSLLRKWVEFFGTGGNRDASAHLAVTRAISAAMNRMAAAALVGRASVLVVQSTQLGAAIHAMPVGSYLKRIGKLMTGQMGWGNALGSAYIQRRLKQMPPIVRQAMAGLAAGDVSQLRHQVQRIGKLIGGADALFTAGTYAMIYDYNLKVVAPKMGMTGSQAEAYAHEQAEIETDRVAQPTRAGARSYFENASTHPAMRLAWAFASESRQKLVLSIYAVARKPWQQKVRALTLTWLVGGLFASVIRAAMRDARDDGEDDEVFDERNWNPTLLLAQSITSPLRGIPFLGEGIESAIFKAMGEYHPEGNLFSVGGKASTAIMDIPEWGSQDASATLKDMEDIVTAAGVFHGGASSATSVLHIIRDIFGVAENLTP